MAGIGAMIWLSGDREEAINLMDDKACNNETET